MDRLTLGAAMALGLADVWPALIERFGMLFYLWWLPERLFRRE